jgi:hypothetical protein
MYNPKECSPNDQIPPFGQLSAMNLARSLIRSEKTISVITQLCSEMAVFGQKSYLPASLFDPILKKKA